MLVLRPSLPRNTTAQYCSTMQHRSSAVLRYAMPRLAMPPICHAMPRRSKAVQRSDMPLRIHSPRCIPMLINALAKRSGRAASLGSSFLCPRLSIPFLVAPMR